MTDDARPRKRLSHWLYRFRRRLAWAIMPDGAIENRFDEESEVDQLYNELHFRIGVAAGYKKGLKDASGSASDYRVEDELE